MQKRIGLLFLIVLMGAAALLLGRWRSGTHSHQTLPPQQTLRPQQTLPSHAGTTTSAQIQTFCRTCHRFPSPEVFPKVVWPKKLKAKYDWLNRDQPLVVPPPMDDVIQYFVSRAPETLDRMDSAVGPASGPVVFEPRSIYFTQPDWSPGIANVNFVPSLEDGTLDLLVCDMRKGQVLIFDPDQPDQKRPPLARIPHPCHTEVIDLDRDGIRDLLVANLGTFYPSNDRQGSVVWLRGDGTGGFTPLPLLENVGRVADVQAADFDADGDHDIVVASFGWRTVGSIIYLENDTVDYATPEFEPVGLDSRSGTIAVPIVDLNGDARPDFVALISQQFETVVAFINSGNGGTFDAQTIFTADHPSWGFSGMEVVDLDQDGDFDVLVVNGDSLDDLLLKPHHGITWLENRGTYPYLPHRLAYLPGVQSVKTGDLDGDGDLDVVACSWLPHVDPDISSAEGFGAIIWLEQTTPGKFQKHAVRSGALIYPSIDLGDYDADGDLDVAVGNFIFPKLYPHSVDSGVLLLENKTK